MGRSRLKNHVRASLWDESGCRHTIVGGLPPDIVKRAYLLLVSGEDIDRDALAAATEFSFPDVDGGEVEIRLHTQGWVVTSGGSRLGTDGQWRERCVAGYFPSQKEAIAAYRTYRDRAK